MLVRELHRDAAAERLADDRGALDAEHAEEVAQRRGEVAERVVARRRRRVAVAGEVGRDHVVVPRELGHHRLPRARAAGHAVDQQQRRALAGLAVGEVVAVERDVLRGERRGHGERITTGRAVPNQHS